MSSNPSSSTAFLQLTAPIEAQMQRFSVPGVSVGVFFGEQEQAAGFGVTSVENPLPVNPETLFQVGSITKTFTAMAAMRLVEMGKLDLDLPVRRCLPDLKLADEEVAKRVTLRHLLTHTAGWVGDYFNDFGWGEDALSKMVEKLRDLPQLTPLGELWSYNNSGFYLAGRLIEVVAALPYETALKELVLEPLGMQHSFFFPEQVISYRFVVGHTAQDGKACVARPWAVGRAIHPIGGLVTNLPDLFRYARYQMGDGTSEAGKRLLQLDTLKEMHTPAVPASGIRWQGLSWVVTDVDGCRLISHGGGTKGQVTFLGICPEKRFAVAVLTNGEDGDPIIRSVWSEALRLFLGVMLPEALPIPASPETLAQYVGTYAGYGDSLELRLEDSGLVIQLHDTGGFPTPETPPSPDPQPVRAALYGVDKLVILDDPAKGNLGEFLRDAQGKIIWLRLGGRIHRFVR